MCGLLLKVPPEIMQCQKVYAINMKDIAMNDAPTTTIRITQARPGPREEGAGLVFYRDGKNFMYLRDRAKHDLFQKDHDIL